MSEVEDFFLNSGHYSSVRNRWKLLAGVRGFIEEFFKDGGHRPKFTFFGSSDVFYNNDPAFSSVDPFAYKLSESDIDLAIELDEFWVEWLFQQIPSLTLKTAQGLGEVYPMGYQRNLRRVYTTSFWEIYNSPRGKTISLFLQENAEKETIYFKKNVSSLCRVDPVILQSISFDICFVRDVNLVESVWSTINPGIFVKYYWKKGPNYIGKEDLEKVFQSLENLYRYGKISKIPLSYPIPAEALPEAAAHLIEIQPAPLNWD